MIIYQETLSTPVGTLIIKASEVGLTEVTKSDNIHLLSPQTNDIVKEAKHQLDEYFKGLRDEFNLPFDLFGYSTFYQSVWKALLDVPYGQTKSYGDIAREIGDIKAVRAVGAANGKNPIGIIIPCHRIIGSTGKLVGYASGIEMKKWLLRHELAHSPVPEHMLF